MIIRDVLPVGLLGLLLAAFFAAYMSTIASQTVWGTSYIVNDLYRPFLKPGAEEKYYVKVSRITTFILIILSLLVTSKLERISDAWKFILEASGGIGLVLIFRWFWWRINAWSEIAAIIAPFIIYPVLKFVFKLEFPHTLLIIVGWSTIVWLLVTFLTRPTDVKTLQSFYRKVHPGGSGWKKVSAGMPDVVGDKGYGYLMFNWFAGCIMVILSLFSIGKLIFGQYLQATIYLVIVALAGFIIYRNMNKVGWGKVI